jgi:dipeptidyl aminopeptidase/acylaminoacyl peptidase
MSGREVRRLTPRHPATHALTFSPDNRLLAATVYEHRGKESIQVWDVTTGEEHGGAWTRESGVAWPAFSPDGRMLATSGSNRTVRLWELASGRQRLQFNGHDEATCWSTFSPDGRVLAAVAEDAPVYLFDVAGHLEYWPPPTPAELEQAWTDLHSEDAAVAFRAMRRLAAAPAQALPFLRLRLGPVQAADPKRVRRLVADLDSDDFAVREKATAELVKLGDRAVGALHQVLKETTSAEAGRRIQEVLRGRGNLTPEHLLATRAAEVLESIGTPEARQLLESLARGVPEARLTREVQTSLERLSRRQEVKP